MIVDILTVLFFVLGLALLFWMKGERRRDVLHYVIKPSRARARVPADLRAQTSLTKLSRIVRYAEGESEMSAAGLQELEELGALGVKLLATARELPLGPDRDNALQLIGRFRVQIATLQSRLQTLLEAGRPITWLRDGWRFPREYRAPYLWPNAVTNRQLSAFTLPTGLQPIGSFGVTCN